MQPIAIALMITAHAAYPAPLTAKEIMAKNEDARRIDDVTSSATLVTGAKGQEKVKQFTWWRKLTGDKGHFNTLTRFLTPAEVRGTGILFLERDNGENDVQMYLPTYKKIRRVESQQQSGSFMGSEFSYADIASPHLEDYTYSLQKEVDCPGAKVRCYVIESTPANDSVRERTGYSKALQWVRQDSFMVVRGEYQDLQGAPWKTMEASELEEVDPVRHKWMARKVRIENLKNQRATTLAFGAIQVNKGIPDSTFSNQNLARER
jgi:outer membrane lipoprotein-sorting protein